MEIFVYMGLTAINILAIIIRRRKQKISLKKYYYRQSTLHQIAKMVLPSNAELMSRRSSQHKNYIKNKTVRVITTPEGIAYWVQNNKFFSADVKDGEFDPTQGIEIDTNKLSKKEIDKLLFILDNLNRGIIDDSGSSGN